jgi:hypothetical protein
MEIKKSSNTPPLSMCGHTQVNKHLKGSIEQVLRSEITVVLLTYHLTKSSFPGYFEMNPILHSNPKDISKKDYNWHIHINLGRISTTAAVANFQLATNCDIQKLTQLIFNRAIQLGTHLTTYLI